MIPRDATLQDLPAIAALYGREVLTGTATFELDPPSLEAMTGRFETVRGHGLPWLVAEIDGAFAGYAYASPFRPRPAYRYGVEGSIYVEENARSCGVGRALLTALVESARDRGLRHVIGAISDSATSDASIRLHRALGFWGRRNLLSGWLEIRPLAGRHPDAAGHGPSRHATARQRTRPGSRVT